MDIDPDYFEGWNGRAVVTDAQAALPRLASEPTIVNMDPKGLRRNPLRYPRLLYKNGTYTLRGRNIPNIASMFIYDFWNTLLDMRWVSVLLMFLLSQIALWMVFGGIFYLINYIHGDYDNPDDPSFPRCIVFEGNSSTFASAFLFSVDTLKTIGYGTPRYPTDECSATIVFLCLGIMVSCLLESVLVGLLLAKTHVPQKRTATLLFSDRAVICTREGQMCLLFRIGNVRTSLLFRVQLKAFLVYAKRTDEGEDMPFHQHEIQLQIDANGEGVYLAWPATACHVINSNSPFYHVSRKNLERAAFEIIVILEGITESTGASIQARTSYTPDEILWAHQFKPCHEEQDRYGRAVFDYTNFNATVPQPNMRDLTAFELDELDDLRQPMQTPTIVLSATDVADSGQEAYAPEPAISPSLAKALDIPYETAKSRRGSVVSSRRPSVAPTHRPSVVKQTFLGRRISRAECTEQGSQTSDDMRLPHVVNLPTERTASPERFIRRVATSLGPLNYRRPSEFSATVRRRVSQA